jgi:hypothetical protein
VIWADLAEPNKSIFSRAMNFKRVDLVATFKVEVVFSPINFCPTLFIN